MADTRTEKGVRRVLITLSGPVADAIRALGLDPTVPSSPGRSGGDCGAVQIHAALVRYGTAIAEARRNLAGFFDQDEWFLLTDVTKDTIDLADYSSNPFPLPTMLAAVVHGAHVGNGAGYGRLHAEDTKAVDRRVEALVLKLTRLTTIEADAVGAAIRDYWLELEHGTDEARAKWWLPSRAEWRA
jgi:hypothetical protein